MVKKRTGEGVWFYIRFSVEGSYREYVQKETYFGDPDSTSILTSTGHISV